MSDQPAADAKDNRVREAVTESAPRIKAELGSEPSAVTQQAAAELYHDAYYKLAQTGASDDQLTQFQKDLGAAIGGPRKEEQLRLTWVAQHADIYPQAASADGSRSSIDVTKLDGFESKSRDLSEQR